MANIIPARRHESIVLSAGLLWGNQLTRKHAESFWGWNKMDEADRTANPSTAQRKKGNWFKIRASRNDPQCLGNERDRFWDKLRSLQF